MQDALSTSQDAGSILELAIQTVRDASAPSFALITNPDLFGASSGWTNERSGFVKALTTAGGLFVTYRATYPRVTSKPVLRQQASCSLGKLMRFSVVVTAEATLPAPYCSKVNLGVMGYAGSVVGELYEDDDLSVVATGAGTSVFSWPTEQDTPVVF
jgi:hypothetical protein